VCVRVWRNLQDEARVALVNVYTISPVDVLISDFGSQCLGIYENGVLNCVFSFKWCIER
jgi:hypothetical protein